MTTMVDTEDDDHNDIVMILGENLRRGDRVWLCRESRPGEDYALDVMPGPRWWTLGQEVDLSDEGYAYRRFQVATYGSGYGDRDYVEVNKNGYYEVLGADPARSDVGFKFPDKLQPKPKSFWQVLKDWING